MKISQYNLVILPLLIALLSGCISGPGIAKITGQSWKEEALQYDGSVLIVNRSVSFGGTHEPFQRGSYSSQSLKFVIPTSHQEVTWEDKISKDIGSTNFAPMLLGVDKDVAYLVTQPFGCLAYNKWGRPNPPYVVFKYRKGWEKISVNELPSKFTKPNLLISSPDLEAKKASDGLVTAKVIASHLPEFKYQPESQIIFREPVSKSAGLISCEEMVWYKCGWGSPGEFSRKFYENTCKDK